MRECHKCGNCGPLGQVRDEFDNFLSPVIRGIEAVEYNYILDELVQITRRERPQFCRHARAWRGDCEHYTGVPKVLNETTTDEYGIPHGWCDYCWLKHQSDSLPPA